MILVHQYEMIICLLTNDELLCELLFLIRMNSLSFRFKNLSRCLFAQLLSFKATLSVQYFVLLNKLAIRL